MQKSYGLLLLYRCSPRSEFIYFNDSYIDYATLHVPASAVEVYKAAEIWNEFGKIEAIGGTDIQQPKSLVTPTDAPVYNLQGQRLTNKPSKGIYIQNGKKVVIK